MSATADDVSATVNEGKANSSNLNKADQIAELLLGDAESETEEREDDLVEDQTDDSTLYDEEESNEVGEADDGDEETDDAELEAAAEDDGTWESVLGISEDKLAFDENGNLEGVRVKVNDFDGVLSIPDLVAGFQTNKAVTMKGQALAEERKTLEGQREQLQQVYSSKLESVDMLTQHFEKQLISEYDSVNWDDLRNRDPAEYAAARSDFATKATELSRIKEAIEKDRATQQQELQQQHMGRMQAYAKEQADLMIQNNPEWSDKAVLKAARDDFQQFVETTYGFTEQEFNSVFDARLIELIKDAKKYRDGATVAQKKKSKPLPKFQKSRGRAQKRKASKLDKLTAASKSATGQNKRDLQASAIAELLIGGQ